MARTKTFITIGVTLLISVLPLSAAYAEDAPQSQPGVEVQARGPIHEAFAQPVDAQPHPGMIAPKEPPALLDEVPPDQKPVGDNVQWIPGYWQWDDDQQQFLWISGFWRQVPPGRTWIPGFYTKVANGWQWTSGYWSGTTGKQQLLPQPPAPVQAEPATPPPSENSILVPGTWVYNGARYRWRPAYYLDYKPGWVWQPAQYLWTADGYVFVDGYWDYAVDNRGLLFAPVTIDPALLAQPSWTYTPDCVVNSDFLATALFVRPAWNCYYFGDYFGAGYARRGFTPWLDYRFGRRYYDPLFAYARRANHATNWERDLRAVYADRVNGRGVLPPHTWRDQQALVRRIASDKTLRETNLRHVTPLTPLANVDRKLVRLQKVPPAERRALEQRLPHRQDLAHPRPSEAPRVTARPGVPARETRKAPPVIREHRVAPAPKPLRTAPRSNRTAPARPHANTRPAARPHATTRTPARQHVTAKPAARPQRVSARPARTGGPKRSAPPARRVSPKKSRK